MRISVPHLHHCSQQGGYSIDCMTRDIFVQQSTSFNHKIIVLACFSPEHPHESVLAGTPGCFLEDPDLRNYPCVFCKVGLLEEKNGNGHTLNRMDYMGQTCLSLKAHCAPVRWTQISRGPCFNTRQFRIFTLLPVQAKDESKAWRPVWVRSSCPAGWWWGR